jgi:hypothetical protein
VKVGDFVRGKPGYPNVSILGIVLSKPSIMLERFGLEKYVMVVDVLNFRNDDSWTSKCPVSMLEVVSEA